MHSSWHWAMYIMQTWQWAGRKISDTSFQRWPGHRSGSGTCSEMWCFVKNPRQNRIENKQRKFKRVWLYLYPHHITWICIAGLTIVCTCMYKLGVWLKRCIAGHEYLLSFFCGTAESYMNSSEAEFKICDVSQLQNMKSYAIYFFDFFFRMSFFF